MAFLLDDIIMAPANFTIWIADKLKDQVNKEMFDVDALKRALEELQERHDREEIPETVFLQLEEKLLHALEEAKRHQAGKEETS